MTIASQISRITALKNRLIARIESWGARPSDLEDCVDAIEGITGTQPIISTASYDVVGNGKRYAQVSDANLVPGNIVNGVSILGVRGTASVTPPSANLTTGTLYYGGANPPSTLTPPSGYDGFNRVLTELTDVNPTLRAQNIKSGVTIMGVSGTYQTPTESKSPTLSELVSGGIASQSITVTPSSGKHLSQVTIPRITKDDGTPISASDIKFGVSILGIQGSGLGSYQFEYPGYGNNVYETSITFYVQGTPSAFLLAKNGIASHSPDPIIVTSIVYNGVTGDKGGAYSMGNGHGILPLDPRFIAIDEYNSSNWRITIVNTNVPAYFNGSYTLLIIY